MTTQVEDGKTPRMSGGSTFQPDGVRINVTSHATNNLYGAYEQISADIGTKDIYLSQLIVNETVDGNPRFKFAVGGSGVEVDLAMFVMVTKAAGNVTTTLDLKLLRIPSGSRLTMAVADDEGSAFSWATFLNYMF